MRLFVSILFFVLCFQALQAQDSIYTRQIIDSLSSSYFHGRGYTNSGAMLASEYIASELSKNKTVPLFGKSYFQEFKIPVNSIVGNPEIRVNNKPLKPAEDFIIWPNAPAVKGKFTLFRLKPNNIHELFMADFSKTFIVIDTVMQNHPDLKKLAEMIQYSNPFRAKGMIVLKDKTMQVHRSQPSSWTYIEMPVLALPDDAESIYIDVKSRYQKKYKVRNIGGIIEGKSDSVIVFSSHYDHIGEFGNCFFPGSHDNASGVSMLLNLSKYFNGIKPDYTLVFLFFTGEEIGLKGSEYYTSHPAFSLKKIKIVLNLDMIGTGDEGITVANANLDRTDFDKLNAINEANKYVPLIKAKGESKGSDHFNFQKNGVNSLFIFTTGGSQAYHSIYDIPSALSLNSYNGIFKLILVFMGEKQ